MQKFVSCVALERFAFNLRYPFPFSRAPRLRLRKRLLDADLLQDALGDLQRSCAPSFMRT
jgi:hypothetical protein